MLRKFLIASVAIATLSGCVRQEDVDLLQKQLIDVKRELSEIKENQNKMKEDIAALSKRVDNVAKVASQNSLEIQKIKTFSGETGKIKGPEKEGEEIVKLPEEPDALYKYGLDAYYKGKIEEARKAFEKFIKKFKNSELYDNALFWIGQTYYAEGKYDTAIKIFDRLINGCKNGEITDCNKLPTALLRKAYSLEKMGEFEKARNIYNEIIKNFPDTEEAEIARKKLEVVR